MKKYYKIYEPSLKDISQFERLNYDCKKELLGYSYNALKLIDDSLNKCDNKTSLLIPFLIALYAVYITWIKDYVEINNLYLILFILNSLILMILLILCIISLLIRTLESPPPVANILDWLKIESRDNINGLLISTLLYKIARSEVDSYKTIKSKTKLLRLIQIITIIYIFIIQINILITFKY